MEAVGGKVPVTITGKFPEKYFKKSATVEVTPVLRWEGGEAKGQPAMFQGEKVQGNNQTISYKAGGTYTMKASFDYVPEMAKSELYLDFKIKKGSKEYTIPSVKIADGVIATSELPTVASANAANSTDAFQRIIKEAKEAQIMFLIQQANLRSSELKAEGIKDFHKQVAIVAGDTKNYKLNNIEISAYASPDGGVKLNTGLAEKRQDNTEKYMKQQLKKGKIETTVERLKLQLTLNTQLRTGKVSRNWFLNQTSRTKILSCVFFQCIRIQNSVKLKSRTSLQFTRHWLTKSFLSYVVLA